MHVHDRAFRRRRVFALPPVVPVRRQQGLGEHLRGPARPEPPGQEQHMPLDRRHARLLVPVLRPRVVVAQPLERHVEHGRDVPDLPPTGLALVVLPLGDSLGRQAGRDLEFLLGQPAPDPGQVDLLEEGWVHACQNALPKGDGKGIRVKPVLFFRIGKKTLGKSPIRRYNPDVAAGYGHATTVLIPGGHATLPAVRDPSMSLARAARRLGTHHPRMRELLRRNGVLPIRPNVWAITEEQFKEIAADHVRRPPGKRGPARASLSRT
jgi:hypothetical protein